MRCGAVWVLETPRKLTSRVEIGMPCCSTTGASLDGPRREKGNRMSVWLSVRLSTLPTYLAGPSARYHW